MVVQSRQGKIPIPNCNLATLMFGSPFIPLSKDQRCLLDAARPETHYLTRHTLRLWSKRFAAGLRNAGLQTGDRVLVFSPNQMFYSVAFLGCLMAGGVFTGANPTYTVRELAHQIRDSGAFFLLAQRGVPLQVACEAAELAGLDRGNIYVFDDRVFDSMNQDGEQSCQYWGSLIAEEAEGETFAWDELDTEEAADRTLALNYSSGTTGVSKGVEITHKNYVANACQFNHQVGLDEDWQINHKHKESFLCFLPLYHAMAQMIYIGVAQVRQTPTYIMERFDFLAMLKYIEKYRISDLIIVPPVMVALAKSPETKKFNLSSVVRVGSGAAPLSRELSEEVEALWPKGQINVKQGWGMTEVTCMGTGWDPRLKSLTNSIGWPSANTEVKIMSLPDSSNLDPDNHVPTELGAKEHGEMWLRGPQVMRGYWKNPRATAETLTPDHWLRTGDIGYFDEEEKLFVTGRLKELIKVKGMQVAPAELDGVCLECEGVADAAVVGVTINEEEHPRAYIVLKPGVPATAETAKRIVGYVNAKVTRHKHITGGIDFVDALPRNPSGKILRRLLRDMAQKEIENSAGGKSKL